MYAINECVMDVKKHNTAKNFKSLHSCKFFADGPGTETNHSTCVIGVRLSKSGTTNENILCSSFETSNATRFLVDEFSLGEKYINARSTPMDGFD